MASERFYCPNLAGDRLTLPPDQGHHLARVLRIGPGHTVLVFDGQGGEAVAVVETADPPNVTLHVQDRHSHPAHDALGRLRLTLAVAMPKGPRAESLVEKATELGVAGLWPLLSERAVVRPGAGRLEKWRRLSIEAGKQSVQSWLPDIVAPQPVPAVVEQLRDFDAAFVAVPPPGVAAESDPGRQPDRTSALDEPVPVLAALREMSEPTSLLAVVGPEGGLTAGEIGQLRERGARPVSLGPSILRIETAALFIATVVAAWSDGRSESGTA